MRPARPLERATQDYAITLIAAITPATTAIAGRTGTPIASSAPTVMGIGGTATWSSGTLPAGLALDATTGKLSGTPSSAFSGNVSLTVSDSFDGASATVSQTLSIVDPVSVSAVGGTVHSDQSRTLAAATATNAVGQVTYAASAATPLPAGLTINASTGALTATSLPTGTYPVAIVATDSSTSSTSPQVQVVSVAPMTVSAFTQATMRVGTTYPVGSAGLASTATNAFGTVIWTGSALPSGFSINQDGSISGTPGNASSGTAVITATDSIGSAKSASRTYAVLNPLSFTTSAIAGRVGQALASTAPVPANLAGAATWTVISGTLPTGLTLDRTTGKIDGTPTSTASTTLTLQLMDASDLSTVTATQSISVVAALTASATGGIVHADQTSSFAAGSSTNASGSVTWAISPSTPAPSGLTVASASGALMATNVPAGTYSVSLVATDNSMSVTTSPVTVTSYAAMVVTSPAFSKVHRGIAYASGVATFTASVTNAAPGGVTWTLSGFPGGLAIGTDGSVSGTVPAATSPATFASAIVSARDSTGFTKSSTSSVSLLGDATATATAASGRIGIALSATAPVPSNLIGTPSYALASGSMPDGLTLDAGTGKVSGTPSTSGTYSLQVRVTDAFDGASGTYTQPVSVGASLVATATGGTAHSDQTSTFAAGSTTNASGGVTWAFSTDTSVPSGLTLAPTTGALTATNVAQGTYPVKLVATDGYGNATSPQVQVVSIAPMTVTAAAQTVYRKGTNYLAGVMANTPTATNAFGAVTWSFNSGTINGGFTISSEGSITGTPNVAGSNSFTLRATDSIGSSKLATYNITTIVTTIGVTAPSITMHSGSTVPATQVTASNTVTPVTFSATGIPAGLSLDPSTGQWSGTATASGTGTIQVSALDGTATTATASESYAISDALVATAPTNVVGHSDQTLASAAPTATNAVGSLTWSIASGAVSGMAINATTGVVTATNVAAGTYPLTLKAIDQGNGSGTTGSFSFAISAPLSLAATANPVTVQLGGTSTAVALSAPTASNAIGQVTYALASASLPSGVTLDTTSGAISGTATAAGSFATVVKATDGTGEVAQTAAVAVTVYAAPTLAAGSYASGGTNGTLPLATYLSATDVRGTPKWELTSGTLPSGMVLDASAGTLTGTFTASTTLGFRVTTGYGSVSAPANLSVTVQTAAPKAGLLAYWKFDENAGTTFADSTGNGHALTVAGTINSLWRTGVSGSAAYFNGQDLATASWGLLTGAAARTMNVWFNTTAPITTNQTFLQWGPNSAAQVAQVAIINSTIGFFGYNADYAVSATGYNDGKWHMLTTAYDGTTMTVYIDGVSKGSKALTLNTGSSIISVGRDNLGGNQYLTGAMDETGIWNRALTGGEVQQLYGNGTPVNVSSIQATAAASVTGSSDQSFSTAAPTALYANGSVSWAFASGSVPAGMSINSTTGVVTSNKTAVGSYPFTLTATDSSGSSTTGSFTVNVTSAQGALTKGLALYWKYDEATGSNVADSSGNGHTFGAGNNSTGSGTAVPWVTGITGSAAAWAGTYYGASQVSGAFLAGATAKSMNTWFKTTSTVNQSMLSIGAAGANKFELGIEAAGIGLTAGGVNYTTPITTANYANGNWHMATVTYDGSNVAVYVDGVAKATGTATLATANTSYILSGLSVDGGNTLAFKGTMDESAMWSRALTASEVSALYNSGASQVLYGPTASATGVAATQGTSFATTAPSASNVSGALTWAVATGSLPTGLTLDASSGILNGTASVAPGIYSFTLSVTDANGASTTTNSFQVAVSAASLKTGLVADWSFESTAADVSGAGRTLTVTNAAATPYTTGIIGNGISFDSTKKTLAKTASFAGPTAGAAKSVNVWAKTTATAFPFSAGAIASFGLFQIQLNGNNVYAQFYGNDFNIYNALPQNGLWHMLSLTYDGSNAVLYVDGVQIGSKVVGTLAAPASYPVVIGNQVDQTTGVSQATFDETGFWGRALTAAEIQKLYNGGSGLTYGNY